MFPSRVSIRKQPQTGRTSMCLVTASRCVVLTQKILSPKGHGSMTALEARSAFASAELLGFRTSAAAGITITITRWGKTHAADAVRPLHHTITDLRGFSFQCETAASCSKKGQGGCFIQLSMEIA